MCDQRGVTYRQLSPNSAAPFSFMWIHRTYIHYMDRNTTPNKWRCSITARKSMTSAVVQSLQKTRLIISQKKCDELWRFIYNLSEHLMASCFLSHLDFFFTMLQLSQPNSQKKKNTKWSFISTHVLTNHVCICVFSLQMSPLKPVPQIRIEMDPDDEDEDDDDDNSFYWRSRGSETSL